MNVTIALLGILAAPIIAFRVTEPPQAQPPTIPPVTFCVTEDGNDGGEPCVWIDPDTGDMYANGYTPEQLAALRRYLEVIG